MPLDSTSMSYDAEPYVVVLARRLRRARLILSLSEPKPDANPSRHPQKNPHSWARRVIAEAHNYLHHRTIPVPDIPNRTCNTPIPSKLNPDSSLNSSASAGNPSPEPTQPSLVSTADLIPNTPSSVYGKCATTTQS